MERDSPDTWDRDTLLRVLRRALHDLGEPVRGLRSVLDHVRDPETSDEDRQEFLDLAVTSADRAADLLAGLRRLVAAVEEPLTPRAVALAPLLQEVWSQIGGAAADLVVETDVTVLADAAALGRVLAEVFDNVQHYGGGTAHVMSCTRNGRAIVQVRDRGRRLTRTEAEAVFAPFHRLQPKSQIEGAGLGLTVARALMARMGGTIRLTHGADTGVEFDLPLPTKP